MLEEKNNTLKNIIIVENGNYHQFNTEQEVIKALIHPKYYEMSKEEKKKILKMRAVTNTMNNKMEVVEDEITEQTNIDNKFVLLDEKTYILSLLKTNKIALLERIDSNVYTKYLDKSNFSKNYIMVNKFAGEILKKYLKSKDEMSR